MTKASDLRDLIAEASSRPEEQRALAVVVDLLSRALSAAVPFRPGFRAELRTQLVARARQMECRALEIRFSEPGSFSPGPPGVHTESD